MSDVQQQIQQTVEQHDVVLFMKGDRRMPQCGFSAKVVSILDSLVSDYETVNVLQSPELRQGIKDFSSWPTIPQLYIKGEFVGGCDIVTEMFSNGELETKLGVTPQEVAPPKLTVTDSALEPLKGALQDADEAIRLEVDARFNPSLTIGPREQSDIVVEVKGISFVFDRMSAKRADGVTIDYVKTPQGPAFKIDNPNEPPKVRQVSVQELKQAIDKGPVELFDVRTVQETEIARIEGARLLDADAQAHISGLSKDTPLYFHCHHGGRSQAAAQHFLSQGFEKVYNVAGGIEAWSLEVDSNVPRY